MDIRDLDEHIEHHLPVLELNIPANVCDRLAVLCHGARGQQVDRLSKERERVIHAPDCRLIPGAVSQVNQR